MHDVLKKSGNNNIVLAVRDRPFERTLTLHKVREDTYLYKRASILHKVREDTYLYKRASILHKFRKETPPSQGTLPLDEVREFLQLERGHNPAFTRLPPIGLERTLSGRKANLHVFKQLTRSKDLK